MERKSDCRRSRQEERRKAMLDDIAVLTGGKMISEDIGAKLEKQFNEEESQRIYSRRKTKVEHPFGHIKHNLGIRNFLLRGREGVKAEISLKATCFNIARIITLLGGVQGFVARVITVQG